MVAPLLVAGLASAGAGVLGGLLAGGDDPKFNPATLSYAGSQGLKGVNDAANRSVDQNADILNEGTNDPSLLGTADDANRTESALGYDPAHMGEALRDRSAKRFSSDLASLHRQNSITGFDTKYSLKNKADTLNLQKQSADQGVLAQQVSYQREMDAARNTVLSQVLGGMGQMVGMGFAQSTAPSAVVPKSSKSTMDNPLSGSIFSDDSGYTPKIGRSS